MPFSKEMILGASGNQGAAGFYTHQIEQSCRFDYADNSHFDRNYGDGTDGSNTDFTLSFWIKRVGRIGSTSVLINPRDGTSATALNEVGWDTSNQFYFNNSNSGDTILKTNGVFRDPTSWFNLVISADLNNGTASERLKIYFNGNEMSYATDNRSSYTSAAGFGRGGSWVLGDYYSGTNYTPDMYLAEHVYIDGTTYGPDSFGETKQGVWIPKDVSGLTFGTLGYYLKFEDSSNLGNDSSGNDNDWTASDIGADHQELQSPTNGTG